MLTSYLDPASHYLADSCQKISFHTAAETEGLISDLPNTPVLGGPRNTVKDVDHSSSENGKKKRSSKPTARSAMNENAIEPEEDLIRLIDNVNKLRLSDYYYGNLSWVDASHILKRSAVGTFLVRDSEHCCYLYTLSVQTRRGPTSCRIDYENGRFRLDSSEELSDKMPRFDSVTDLIDHYVHLTKNLPRKSSTKDLSPVWLDMDEENSRDVPVQIYRPLYKNVRSLQHICRVNLVKMQREGGLASVNLRTSNGHDCLPTMLRNYLQEYPYPQ